jgi:hypothetical protein
MSEIKIWKHTMPERPEGEPEPLWLTSKLLFKPMAPGQSELTTAMRESVEAGIIDMNQAGEITWRWLMAVHGGDEQ